MENALLFCFWNACQLDWCPRRNQQQTPGVENAASRAATLIFTKQLNKAKSMADTVSF